MNKNHLYAFYGSLRRGMENYEVYKEGLEYLFTANVPGYRLHAWPWYPYAVKSEEAGDTIVVEVFRVIDIDTENAIHELEMEVGYVYDEVVIKGTSTGIYRFEKPGSEPFVEGGDWVKFFGSR